MYNLPSFRCLHQMQRRSYLFFREWVPHTFPIFYYLFSVLSEMILMRSYGPMCGWQIPSPLPSLSLPLSWHFLPLSHNQNQDGFPENASDHPADSPVSYMQYLCGIPVPRYNRSLPEYLFFHDKKNPDALSQSCQ